MPEPKSPKPNLTLTFNPLSLFFTIVGAMLCLGILTLDETRPMTLLIGIVTLLVAQSGLLRFGFHFENVSESTFTGWAFVLAALGIFVFVAVLRALVVIL